MKKYLVPFFVLAVLTAAVYGKTLNYPFVFDDINVVVKNPALRYLSNIPRFFTTMGPGGEDDLSGLYRPVVFSSFTVNYILSGLDTFSYHLFDVVLHIINSFLLFLVITALQKVARQENRTAALLFSALFCVHPVLTQSVIYISARSVLLMTFFWLGSLLAYVKYRTTGKGGLLVLSASLFLCALLTKESAVPFIGVIFLMELFFRKRNGDPIKRTALNIAPFLAFASLFVAARLYFLSKAPLTLMTGEWSANWIAGLTVLPRYFFLALSPFGLCVEHYIPDARVSDGYFIAGAVLLIVFLVVFYSFLKKDVLAACLFAWPLLALLPEMALPLPERMVEYRLYLPVAGIICLIGVASVKWFSRIPEPVLKVSAVLMVLLLATSAAIVLEKEAVWRSPITLWQDAVKRCPDIARPYNNLGLAYIEAGRYAEAAEVLAVAIRVNPDSDIVHRANDEAYNNLAVAYAALGDYLRAKETLEQGLRINPLLKNARRNLQDVNDYLDRQKRENRP